MCTLTYLPIGENDFFLTQNRDENYLRSPKNISRDQLFDKELIFPRDHAAGGTWIVASNTNQFVCILNGAFDRHQRKAKYRRSRGLMALDFFSFKNVHSFFNRYQFEEMEPFTMISYDNGELVEIRWDGQGKHWKSLDTKAQYIWSSSTLYPSAMQEKRQAWFDTWRNMQTNFDKNIILDFHRNGGEGDPYNDFVMNRMNLVQTVSITCIAKKGQQIQMNYLDLLHQDEKIETLTIPSTRESLATH